PHVLGHSIGGWTAVELATMSPASIDRLVLVAPVGLKPETGEILDIFYFSPAQLLTMMVHDSRTGPEWQEVFGRAPTPAGMEAATRNREMAARLTWKPYMHNPRLAHFLPRVTNPTLIVWGREDRAVPVECREQYRQRLPNATLAVVGRCGHVPPVGQANAIASMVAGFRARAL